MVQALQFTLNEIADTISAVSLFLILITILFLAFDKNTIETTLGATEMSHIATALPENAQVTYQINEDGKLTTSNNEFRYEIGRAAIIKSYSNPADVSVVQDNSIIRISS